MKAIAIPILTVITIAGMAIWGPWFLLAGLAGGIVGGVIEGIRNDRP